MRKLICLALVIGFSANAQYFGQNKARYKNFDFKVVQSPHFEMYHYFNNPDMSKRMIVNSEHWYKQHQEVFKTAFGQLNPIIFYKTHPDFQETTAISGQIGEGTGGVTEGLKNRVVMPLMYSHRQTDHVLGHELVHAFQYHTFATGDSTTMENIGNLPLFMVEGLAEYMSIGRIDAHTAMWLRDGILNNDLPTVEDLVVKQNKYFPYRWGECSWHLGRRRHPALVSRIWQKRHRVGLQLGAQSKYRPLLSKVEKSHPRLLYPFNGWHLKRGPRYRHRFRRKGRWSYERIAQY
jgi:hypothetical protein